MFFVVVVNGGVVVVVTVVVDWVVDVDMGSLQLTEIVLRQSNIHWKIFFSEFNIR
jgi:hypothetical protein